MDDMPAKINSQERYGIDKDMANVIMPLDRYYGIKIFFDVSAYRNVLRLREYPS